MVFASMRPWYRFHWLTYFIIGLQAIVLVDCQRERYANGETVGDDEYRFCSHTGWPLAHRMIIDSAPVSKPWGQSMREHHWMPLPLAINCLVASLLVASTIFVLELWLRSARRAQIALGSLLITTGVAAIMLAIARLDSPFWFYRSTLILSPNMAWEEFYRPLRLPIVLGFACTLYALFWWSCRAIGDLCAMGVRGKSQRYEIHQEKLMD
jgi:hypothetical protein